MGSSGGKYWAVIPAAGIGSRMQAEIPKQYLQINDKCILEYTLECFCSHTGIAGVVVVIAANDDLMFMGQVFQKTIEIRNIQ